MLSNYIRVAIRNLVRNKFFSILNIVGLAVGMTICMAIIMLVADQMMYDRHNTKRDRIFRVNSYAVDNNGADRSSIDNAASPMPLRNELAENYTGLEQVVRIRRGFGNGWFELENQDVNIPIKGFFADPEVLSVFEYTLEHGDPSTALVTPYSVVLTRRAADKLFSDANPVGKTIRVGNLGTYTVTGVLKETENKSHIVFEALASMSSVESLIAQDALDANMNDWLNFWDGWTYVVIEPGKSPEDIQQHLQKIYKKRIASVQNPEVYKASFRLQALTAITPGPLINNPIGPSLPWVFVYFLGGLAATIMMTSCFNFTNLSIARSLKRAKEIGVRKVTGAARWQIFVQFLSESIVIAFCALVLAGILLFILKPFMLQLTFARLFKWDLEANYAVFAVFGVFTIAVGIVAGFFPAVVLSGFQPVKVLKNLSTVKLFSRMALRRALLVSQFTLSLIFILSVIVMYNQLELFVSKDYGFNMKKNIMVRLNSTSAQALKNELLKQPAIVNVSGASHLPAAGTTNTCGFKKELQEKDWTNLNIFNVDEDYAANMEVALVAGSFFESDKGKANEKFIVINEESVNAFHYKSAHEALGQEVLVQFDSSKRTIIGVVENYNHNQLFSKIEPLALFYNPEQISLLQVRYTGSREEGVASINKAWASVNPGLKIDSKEVEEEIKMFYNTVFGDLVNVLGVIASLAIMISCLGLLGMATYTIESRTKEISIRKVLGSSDQALVFLLSKGFLKILVISVLLGLPAAWFINNLWLELLAYHTSLSPGVAIAGVLILVTLGAITIGSQTLRATFTNPADNLRSE